jgi:hypothetical protein
MISLSKQLVDGTGKVPFSNSNITVDSKKSTACVKNVSAVPFLSNQNKESRCCRQGNSGTGFLNP